MILISQTRAFVVTQSGRDKAVERDTLPGGEDPSIGVPKTAKMSLLFLPRCKNVSQIEYETVQDIHERADHHSDCDDIQRMSNNGIATVIEL